MKQRNVNWREAQVKATEAARLARLNPRIETERVYRVRRWKNQHRPIEFWKLPIGDAAK